MNTYTKAKVPRAFPDRDPLREKGSDTCICTHAWFDHSMLWVVPFINRYAKCSHCSCNGYIKYGKLNFTERSKLQKQVGAKW